MKPRKASVYDSVSAKPFFTTPRRKVVGYVVLLSLIGTLMFYISQDLRSRPSGYDLADLADKAALDSKNSANADAGINHADSSDSSRNKNDHHRGGSLNGIPGSLDDEKLAEKVNADLAKINMDAKNAVVEAPKGGIANEANVVGTDKDQLMAGAKPASARQANGQAKGKAGSAAKQNAKIDSGIDVEPRDGDLDIDIDLSLPLEEEESNTRPVRLNANGEPDLIKSGRHPKEPVVEAPKGGVANEANVVGADQEELIGRPKPPSAKNIEKRIAVADDAPGLDMGL